MTLSEISIRRPVFATVICLLLVFIGLMSMARLAIREMPQVDRPVISIQTEYRGSSAAVIESRVTQVLEDGVAGIEGIDILRSSSSDESSRITMEFSLERDLEEAANDVRDRVARLTAALPEEADPPRIAKADSNRAPVVFLNLSSEQMSVIELTDYAERNITDRFSAVPGVARAYANGGHRPAMRVWLDHRALAARRLTASDVEDALRRENVERPAGRLESRDREFTLRTDTRLKTEQQFRDLVIHRGAEGYLVRLGEVADVRLAAENERATARFEGRPGLNINIEQQSTANVLAVADAVEQLATEIAAELPEHMQLRVLTNNGAFIRASLKEVAIAIVVSLVCVIVVIYGFIGSWRATLIPALTIPISIVASGMFMYAMGYSINVLTLLAMVLAIGLVVDDGIVVLENIHRHRELGKSAVAAALDGSREIGFAVIATTLVLATVFIPLSFLTGQVGRLFVEFGFTLAAAILFSCLVALTLVPMLSSQILTHDGARGRIVHALDGGFRKLTAVYTRALQRMLPKAAWVMGAVVLVLGLSVLMFRTLQSEAMPAQDTGHLMVSLIGPEGASFEYMNEVAREIETRVRALPGSTEFSRVYSNVPQGFGEPGMNRALVHVGLVDYVHRTRTAQQVAAQLQRELADVPGVQIAVAIGGRGGFGANAQRATFIVQGPDYETLGTWRDLLLPAMEDNPAFVQVDVDFQERKPQMLVQVDRDRASDLGVSTDVLSRTLETMLGSRVATTFAQAGREYNVVLQGRGGDRSSPDDLGAIFVRSAATGELIPISNIASVQESAGANELRRFNRQRAVTFSVQLESGYSQDEAVASMRDLVDRVLPPPANLAYDGATREYLQSSQELYLTFAWALLVVFLVLAAQFESYVTAFVILATVPLAMIGAVLGLFLMGVTINIYSQIAIVMLIGLAAKNGVLIVEFANQLRDGGRDFRSAVIEAAATRLRPVLMTSFCAAFGALPLFFAHGAGAETRHPVGVVVLFGVVTSMVLTLFVVPASYALIARNARTPQWMNRSIDQALNVTRAAESP